MSRRHGIPGATRGVALVASVALVFAGCISDAPTPEVTPTPTPEVLPTATVTTYRLDTTVWYGGFVLTFGSARATIDLKGGPVEVELTMENLGPEDETLSGPIVLAAGGLGFEPSRNSVLPSIPAGGIVDTTIVFEVDGTLDLAAAAIRIGRSDEHQAIVPLVSGPAETVTLEPVVVELTGRAQAGAILVTVRAAELRADMPDWGLELPRGSMALTLTYDASFRGNFAGGFPFTTENIGLALPDGRTISARADGHSAPAQVLKPGVVATGLRSRFEVPAPGTGQYALVVRDGSTARRIPLTIESSNEIP